MQKILVTTDFSSNSKAGIRFAIQLASQTPCELIFYNVIELTDINVWTDRSYTDFSGINIAVRQDKLRKFIMAIYRQSGKVPGKVDFVIDSRSEIDTSIIAFAEKSNIDIICMSTRGGGIISKFMGTNASRLITASPVPLLVVPHSYRSKALQSILYASDLEKIDVELKIVAAFATAFNANISVYNYDAFIDEDGVRNKQKQIAAKYKSDKVSFHFEKFYIEHSLLHQLQDAIQKSKPSIVTMFTKQNRDWFERLFLSSKTAELGFDTTTPMLVFRKKK
ncbi:MAG: universal stress protein [Flavobacterium sp.]|nr:universal stress protein [Flavobacterium sp.]